MQCANPQCGKELIYLREGRLQLLELQLPFRQQLSLDNGFPANPVPSRYFWLCGGCMKTYTMRRWTTSGLVVEFSAPEFGSRRMPITETSDSIGTTTLLSA
jgi:hypothetical protein